MPTNKQILNEVIRLQDLHAEGLKRATMLREHLEGESSPSSRKGLSVHSKGELRAKRLKTFRGAVSRRNIQIERSANV